jgi:surfeit locus 1 family protein
MKIMMIRLKKTVPPAGAVLITLLMLAILLALGTWQVRRLAWKTALLAELAQAYRSDAALHIDDFTKAATAGTMFLHGRITGTLIGRDTILIGPRTHDGVPGYHVLAPLRLDSGGTVLVNRGWIAADGRRAALDDRGNRHVRVTGMARRPDRANMFTPENQPDSGQWYSIDTGQIAAHTGLALPPYVLYAETVDGAPQTVPLTFGTGWTLPNDHLHYAIFWFTMAGVLALIFILRFFVVLPEAALPE